VINSNYILVVDLETTGLSWLKDEPVQIASLAIDPYKLEIIEGSEFNSLMKPVNILSGSEQEISEKWNKCWKAWEVNKKTRSELEKAPLPQHVWKEFANYVKKYNTGGKSGKPIVAGHNIQNFDLFWIRELCKKYKMIDINGEQNLFNTRTILDTLNILFLWFENLVEPENLSMNTLRPYFGIDDANAHDALGDCRDTANILIRFLKLHRRCAPKAKFKGAFKGA
jgi:DNA polymerase III epsilon subunit-like protein